MRTLLSNITGFYIFPFPLIWRQNFKFLLTWKLHEAEDNIRTPICHLHQRIPHIKEWWCVLSYSFKRRCIILCLSHTGWKNWYPLGNITNQRRVFNGAYPPTMSSCLTLPVNIDAINHQMCAPAPRTAAVALRQRCVFHLLAATVPFTSHVLVTGAMVVVITFKVLTCGSDLP